MTSQLITVFIVISTLLTGCGSAAKTLSEMASFTGQAEFASGDPVRNALLILQPIEQGYEIELETDAKGQFRGEGVPGRYVYYFADSKQQKSTLPKNFPVEYRDPRKEHEVALGVNQHIVCRVDQ